MMALKTADLWKIRRYIKFGCIRILQHLLTASINGMARVMVSHDHRTSEKMLLPFLGRAADPNKININLATNDEFQESPCGRMLRQYTKIQE